MDIGDISGSSVKVLIDAAQDLGCNPDELLAAEQLSWDHLTRPEIRLPLTQLMRLGQRAIAESGNPILGLHMARRTMVTDMGLPGLLAMTAPTLGEALDVLTRFEPLIARCYRGQSRYSEGDRCLRFYSIAPYNDANRFVVESILGGWVRLACWLTRGSDWLDEVHIEYPAPSYAAAFTDCFPVPVRFGQAHNQLVLAPGASQKTVRYHNEALHRQLNALATLSLMEHQTQATFAGRVQQLLGTMMHGEPPSLEAVAAHLGLPDWTLRRRLKQEGTSFQTLVDDTRRDLALAWLKQADTSLGEIAYLLGFSTPGAFQRAFKRWTGLTPGEFRRTPRRP